MKTIETKYLAVTENGKYYKLEENDRMDDVTIVDFQEDATNFSNKEDILNLAKNEYSGYNNVKFKPVAIETVEVTTILKNLELIKDLTK